MSLLAHHLLPLDSFLPSPTPPIIMSHLHHVLHPVRRTSYTVSAVLETVTGERGNLPELENGRQVGPRDGFHNDFLFQAPPDAPQDLGARARTNAAILVRQLYELYQQTKKDVLLIRDKIAPTYKALLRHANAKVCPFGKSPSYSEYGDLQEELDQAPNPLFSKIENLRRLRILSAVRKIADFMKAWDPDDGELEGIEEAIVKLDPLDLKLIK